MLVQQNTMHGPGIANTTYIEFSEMKGGKKKWPPMSVARLKHCSAIERTTGKRNVACIHLDVDGVGVKSKGKFEVRFEKNDDADKWFALLTKDFNGIAKVASHVMALSTVVLKDALKAHEMFVASDAAVTAAAAASGGGGSSDGPPTTREGYVAQGGGGAGGPKLRSHSNTARPSTRNPAQQQRVPQPRAGAAGAVPPGNPALGYIAMGGGPALRAQQTRRQKAAGGGAQRPARLRAGSTGASPSMQKQSPNAQQQQQQQQQHGGPRRAETAPPNVGAGDGPAQYENFKPGGIAAQDEAEHPTPKQHPRRSPPSPAADAAVTTAAVATAPPALPVEEEEEEEEPSSRGKRGGRAGGALPPTSKAVATVDLRNMHIYDDVQCCSECRKSVSLGVTDDNDGSWYCAECWARFVKDGGEHTVEDGGVRWTINTAMDNIGETDETGDAGSKGGASGMGGVAGTDEDGDATLLAQAVSGIRASGGGGGRNGDGGGGDVGEYSGDEEQAYTKFFATTDGMEAAPGAETAPESLPPAVADTTDADLQEAEAAEAENAAESAASATSHAVMYHGYSGTLAPDGVEVVVDAKEKLDALASFGLSEGASEHLLVLSDTGIQIITGTDPAGEVVQTLDTGSITFSHLSEEGCLSIIVTDLHSRMSICHCMDACTADDNMADILQRVQVFAEGAIEEQNDVTTQRKAHLSTDLTQFARKTSVRLQQSSGKASLSATSSARGKGNGVQRMFSVKRVSQEAARNNSSRSNNGKPSSTADMRTPIGIVTCSYLGSVSVPKQQGNDVLRLGLGELAKSVDFSPTGVAAVSSLFGLKVISVNSSEELVEIPVRNVTFSAPIEDEEGLAPLQSRIGARWKSPVFGIIHVNPQLQSNTLELFQVLTKGDLATMQKSISAGTTHLVSTLHKRRMNNGGAAIDSTNPFKPTSDTGDIIPPILAKHQVSRRGLKPLRVLGQGAFGEVWLAKERTPPAGHQAKYLAVKMVKTDSSASDGAAFLAECEVMTLLRHPNLLRMHGVSIRQTPWLVVIDFIKYGDLHKVLRTCRAKKLPLRYSEQYYFAAQIACGMRYVAMQRLVHMDLATRNVLLSENNEVKVADFGLTQKLAPGKTTWRLRTKMCLPQRWQSVEGMNYQVFSEKSDVWSFGVTCWEIMTYGRLPYPGVKLVKIKSHVSGGGRLEPPKGYPDSVLFWGIIEKCWNAKHQERPTFNDLVKQMVSAGEDEEKKGYTHEMRDIGKMLRSTPAADAGIYGDPNTDATDLPVRVPWPPNLHFVWGSKPVSKRKSAPPVHPPSTVPKTQSPQQQQQQQQQQQRRVKPQSSSQSPPPAAEADPSEMDF